MNWNSAVTRSDAITQDFCTLVMTSFIKLMLLINCLNPLTLSFSTIRYYFSENASSEILTFYYNWFFVNTAFACHLRSEELTEMNLPLKTVPTPFWSRFSTHLPPQINYGRIATQYRGVTYRLRYCERDTNWHSDDEDQFSCNVTSGPKHSQPLGVYFVPIFLVQIPITTLRRWYSRGNYHGHDISNTTSFYFDTIRPTRQDNSMFCKVLHLQSGPQP